MNDDGPPELEPGVAGASARREHERRRAARQARTRKRHPGIGGLLLALRDVPASEASWERGAGGEEHVARVLAKHVDPDVVVLHDRRIPGTRANIDHLAVAPSGVWVIDTKRYKGKVAVRKPLFGQAKLIVAGRDKTKLVDGLAQQTEAVRTIVKQVVPETPVYGAFCFVDADLPLLGSLRISGFSLLAPKPLAKRLNRNRSVAVSDTRGLAKLLATEFPAA